MTWSAGKKFIAVFMLLYASLASASMSFRHYDFRHGLPHLVVTSLVEDAQGFIWAGTQGGLGRFDGLSFKVYRKGAGAIAGLPDNAIKSLLVDRSGHLWVLTFNGGIALYQPDKDDFIHFTDELFPELRSDTMVAIADSNEACIWVAFKKSGLRCLTPDGRILRVIDTSLNISALYSGEEKTLYLGTAMGQLWRLNGERFEEVLSLPTENHIEKIVSDDEGALWLATIAAGLQKFEPQTGVLVQVGGSQWANAHITDVKELDARHMVASAHEKGLLIIDKSSAEIREVIKQMPRNNLGIQSDRHASLLVDSQGLLWVGTWGQGLSLHNPGFGLFKTLSYTPENFNGQDINNVASLLTISDQRFLVAGTRGGIVELEIDGDDFQVLKAGKQSSVAGMENLVIQSVYKAGNGDLWLGAVADGLQCIRLDGEKEVFKRDQGLINDTVRVVRQGGDGLLWLGTDAGLQRFDPVKREFLDQAESWLSSQTAVMGRVTDILHAPDGTVWATSLHGLAEIRPDAGKVTIHTQYSTSEIVLPSNTVSSLLLDDRERLWIGSVGGGLSVLDLRTRHFISLQGKHNQEGLPLNDVGKLIMDNEGFIWASLSDGIARVNPNDMSARIFGIEHGLGVDAYWVGSGAKLTNGLMVFGGNLGITLVDPIKLNNRNTSKGLVITGIETGGHKLFTPPGHDGLMLDDARRSFSVSYTNVNYIDQESIYYSHMLEGFDKDWSTLDKAGRLAMYTNLPPGHYTLKLRTRTPGQEWSSPRKLLSVNVAPRYYETPWFWGLLLLAFFGLIWLLVKMRSHVQLHRRMELQQQVKRRTAELLTLGDIARDLNSILDVEELFLKLHDHVCHLTDAFVFGVGIMDKDAQGVRFDMVMEDQKRLPVYTFKLTESNRLAVQCVANNLEILIHEPEEQLNYVKEVMPPAAGIVTRSIIYVPLHRRDGEVMGCLTVQTNRSHAYDENTLRMMRTLASYTAIAIDNSFSFRKIQEQRQKLEEAAMTDYLTNLSNRRAFSELAEREYIRHQRGSSTFTVILADLDDFKQVNDTYGHEVGDQVLVRVADILKSCLREQDLLARWGGEEFIFLLVETDELGGKVVAEKMRTTVADARFEYSGKLLPVSMSFGVCVWTRQMTLEDSINRADDALYSTKKDGKNHVTVWRGIGQEP